jgi:short-subunit dehydrogenase
MKNAIVTGGSSGLGFAMAKSLLLENINVVILGRNKMKLDYAKSLLEQEDSKASVQSYQVDISNESEVESFYSSITSADYLFNVAGVGVFGDVKEVKKIDIETVLNANLIGLILMTTHFLKSYESVGGKIVNIMSTAAQVGKKNEAIYCASKWGARGYTEALKATYKGSNIKIHAIYPGGMDTAFWANDVIPRNVSSFMKPDDVARQIVQSVCLSKGLYVSDLIIERP